MARICFVTYEIHPTVSGGCGVLLYNNARLLLSQGHEVIFLLDLSDKPYRQFVETDRLLLPNPNNCRAYQVEALTSGMAFGPEHFQSIFEFNSFRFHHAASQVDQLEHPNLIEFFEYCGAAYHALSAKIAGLNYANTHLAVRLHNSLELIDIQQPGEFHSIDRFTMYDLEHQTLRLAESVLYPSESFLNQAYLPFYEPWFGQTVLLPPPLVDTPVPSCISDTPNIILFYGRLVGVKGVDRFVDAAVLYLNDPQNPRREFYLVGYDSNLPPGSNGSYQSYLLRKIPSQFRSAFHFTGKLTWQALGSLLPQVLFAVIPSYIESFCYAAHELYAAGVPLIVSDIPAFSDTFKDESNALVFDGTAGHLASQMKRMSLDGSLREKFKHPFPVEPSMGNFYTQSAYLSWINSAETVGLTSLLVCVLCDQTENLQKTLRSLVEVPFQETQLILAYPSENEEPGQVVSWFLGKLYSFRDSTGNPLAPTQICTCQTLLILKAGDCLDGRFFQSARSILQRQPQISFVTCWKRIRRRKVVHLQASSLDASLELLPISGSSAFARAIMRTPPGQLLIDLFDSRAGYLGEIAYLWQLDDDTHSGLVIPQPLADLEYEEENLLLSNTADYLFIRDANPWRKKRLSRYLMSLADRNNTLRSTYRGSQLERQRNFRFFLEQAIFWVGASRLNRWLNLRLPWVKTIIRKTARALHLFDSRAD